MTEYREMKAELIRHHELNIKQLLTMDEQFTQSWDASIVLDQWTAEEVEEHLTAASMVSEEQE